MHWGLYTDSCDQWYSIYRGILAQNKTECRACTMDMLVLIGLQSLKMRRDNICKAYFNRLKCNTHRLNHLIPERRDVHYSLRNANVYPIPVTRTDRYKNSIVPCMGLCNWQ